MTQEVLKLALEALENFNPEFVCQATHHKRKNQHSYFSPCPNVAKYDEAITAIKEALRENAMREVQRLGQEIEQEPVGINGLTKVEEDATASVRGLINTTPPQRTWVGLTESDRRLINFEWQDGNGTATEIIDLVEAKLKEKNT